MINIHKITKKAFAAVMSVAMVTGLFVGMGIGDTYTVKAQDYGISNPRIGEDGSVTWDKIKFGSYKQSVEFEYEPIKWRILSVDENNNALLLADKGLDCKPYNEEAEDVTWETSTLRTWLNDDFYNEAFTEAEQAEIKQVMVKNDDNPKYGTEGGNNTSDKVYLLSIEEASNSSYGFNTSNVTRECKFTDYAYMNGEWRSSSLDYAGYDDWWLRSPGNNSRLAVYVNFGGWRDYDGDYVYYSSKAIRPALQINLSSSLVTDAGEVASDGIVTDSDDGYNNPKMTDAGTVWDCVYFGRYKQNSIFGKEPIEWRVLSVDGDEALLLADKGLDCKPYNEKHKYVTWETCTLRAWLNDDFYKEAFNESEKSAIKQVTVKNDDNPKYGTEGGNNTTDKVYLLSIEEARNSAYGFDSSFGTESAARECKVTDYARMNGAWRNSSSDYAGNGNWWLRSPGYDSGDAADVEYYGWGDHIGNDVDDDRLAIRPALRINLSSSVWEYSGTVDSTGRETIAPKNALTIQSAIYKYGSKSVDILTTSHKVEQSHRPFTIECKANSDADGITYYIDTGKSTLRSTDGTFTNVNPDDFNDGDNISIVAKDSAGNAYKTETLLKIGKECILKGSSIKLGKDTSFQLGDNVPLIGGSTVNFNVPSIPVSAVIEDGKIKVGYNIKEECLFSSNSDEGVTTTTNKKKKTIKQQWNDIKYELQKTGYINQDYKGYLEQCDLQGGLPGVEKSVNYNIAGYAEGVWSSDAQIETVSGEIVISISGSATARKQLMVWVVPISLRITASASGTLTGNVTYDFIDSELKGDLSLLASVSLEPFAGVGVSDWLSVGGYGKGIANVYATLLSSTKPLGLDKITLQGQAGIKGYFAKKEAINIKLYDSDECEIWARDNSTKTKSVSMETYKSGLNEKEISLQSVYNYNITDEETEWLKYNSSDTAVAELFAETEANCEQTLVSNIYGASTPQLVSLNGVKVYGYVDETGTRDITDQTVAKYVVYDEKNNTGTEELLIDDNGTADYKLQFVSDGDELYAVYLDSDTVFGSNEPDIKEYAKSFKVTVAYFDKEQRKFVKLGTYNREDNYCYNSSLAITDDGFVLSWCENSDNEIMALTETNQVYSVVCDNKGNVKNSIKQIARGLKAVTSLTADKDGNVMYFVDEDNLLTTEKQLIYYYEKTSDVIQNITKCESADNNVSMLSYQNVPGTSTMGILCLCDGILAYYDSENKEIKYCDESAYIGNSSCYYVHDSNIYYIGNNDIIDEDENTSTPLDSRNICRLTYNAKEYIPSILTSEEGHIDYFATDGESFIYSVGQADYGSYSSESFDTKYKLKYIAGIKRPEINIDDVIYDYNDFTGGEEVPIYVYVTNSGTEILDGIDIVIMDAESNTIIKKKIEQTLVAGETSKVELTIENAASYALSSISICAAGLVKNNNVYTEVTDSTSETIALDKTELAIEGDVRVDAAGNTYVHLDAINSSLKDTTAVVTLFDGENCVYEKEIFVAADSTEGVDVEGMIIPDSEKLYTAEVKTEDEEFYTNDNETQIIVSKLEPLSVERADADKYDKVDEEIDNPQVTPGVSPDPSVTPESTATPTKAPEPTPDSTSESTPKPSITPDTDTTPKPSPTPAPTAATDSTPTPTTQPTSTPVSATQPTTTPASATQPTAAPTATQTPIVSTTNTQNPAMPDDNTQNDNKDTTLKRIKLTSVKCKKGAMQITGKLSVSKAAVKIKVGSKAYKKATVKGRKFTLKVPRLKKNTKVTIKVTKSGYKSLVKLYKVK